MFDALFKCHLEATSVKEVECVLQGPYDDPPYLPARAPGSSMRFFTVATTGELNIDLNLLGDEGRLKVHFRQYPKKTRNPAVSGDQTPNVHEPFVMRLDQVKKELFASVKLIGQDSVDESSPSIVWGTHPTRGTCLSWLMLVIPEPSLRKLCRHEDQAEKLAHLPDAELDRHMQQYGPEKMAQLIAVYTRHLQLHLEQRNE